jgi:tRNA (cytidine/uridine-2'-O-)-methyltransferase
MVHVVLLRPEIPHNTGAVGRLCLATGARLHLVKPLGFSLDDRHLKRAGLDYWRELDVRVWESYADFRASDSGRAECFMFSTKASRTYWTAAFPDECCLVFGPESRGLPESMLQADEGSCLRIPMEGTRSLNLATAVGIALYEVVRQHDSRGIRSIG